MAVVNTVQMLEGIHFILVCWFGGDRVKVLDSLWGKES